MWPASPERPSDDTPPFAPETVSPGPPAPLEPDQPDPSPPESTDRPPQHTRRSSARNLVAVALVSALVSAAVSVGVVAALDGDAPPAAAPAASTTSTSTVPPSPATTVPAALAPLDPATVGERVIPSVVTVQVGNAGPNGFAVGGSGSGVVIDERHIVTNEHVVSSGNDVQVVLSDGRVYDAQVVGVDATTDLAVLRVEADGLSPIGLGSTDGLTVGDPAVAVGSPLGLEGGPSLTVGVLSAFGRQVQTDASTVLYGMLQTDAPITQGSSGGALVDRAGRLIGITTAVGVSQVGIEGIGFATPIEIVRRVTDELIETGSVTHAFLGIVGSTDFATADDGARLPAGVAIQSVEDASAADRAGLAAGDVITSLDGLAIQTMDDLIVALRTRSVGDAVQLTIQGAEPIEVTLGQR